MITKSQDSKSPISLEPLLVKAKRLFMISSLIQNLSNTRVITYLSGLRVEANFKVNLALK